MYQLTLVIQLLMLVTFLWTACSVLRGLSRRRKERELTGDPCRFGIVVCAHNEEKVVGKLLQSLEEQDYDPARYHVFLLADHCGDGTAEAGEKFPHVTVWQRNEGPRSGKGAVLSWGIPRILHRWGGKITHLVVFDADNAADPGFLRALDRSFRQGARLVMGNRLPLNPYDNLITRWYTLYWTCVDVFLCKPNFNLHRPAIVSGTGFGFDVRLLDGEKWQTRTIVEDLEFSMQQNFKGIFADYQEDARFYDEQPATVATMVHQFRRWFTGNYEIARMYWKKWLRHFAAHPDARLIDNFIPMLLCAAFGFYFLASAGWVLYNALSGRPLFHLKDILWWSMLYVLSLGIGSWAVKLGHLSLKRMFPGVLTGGIFCILLSLLAVYSLFFPQRKWIPIAHVHQDLPPGI